MRKLLFHASHKRLRKWLKVNEEGYISFSINCFVSKFGNYIYIFDFEQLKKDFGLKKHKAKKGENRFSYNVNTEVASHTFCSAQLKDEWRAYKNVDLERYCLGVAKHFDESKTLIEEKIIEKVIKEIR